MEKYVNYLPIELNLKTLSGRVWMGPFLNMISNNPKIMYATSYSMYVNHYCVVLIMKFTMLHCTRIRISNFRIKT